MATYTLISSVTVGAGGASSIDFTSIPATYTDLVLKWSSRGTAATNYDQVYIKFNNSTANLSYVRLYGNGTSAASTSGTDGYIGAGQGTGSTASTFDNGEVYIPNYTGSNNKSFSVDEVNENNATAAFTFLQAGLWSNTAAINRITLTPTGGTFVQYSTAYLYGVKSS